MLRVKQILLHSFLPDLFSHSPVIVDLGANEGEFARAVADVYGATVYAVEPLPELFKKFLRDPRIRAYPWCIAAASGPQELKRPLGRCATLYGNGTEVLKVQGVTFERFLEEARISHIDLLKVDIEGAELPLFENLPRDILDRIDQIAVEFHDFLWPELKEKVEKIKRDLTVKGFYCIPLSLFTNGDVLFVKKKLISSFHYLYLKWVARYLLGIKRKLGRLST